MEVATLSYRIQPGCVICLLEQLVSIIDITIFGQYRNKVRGSGESGCNSVVCCFYSFYIVFNCFCFVFFVEYTITQRGSISCFCVIICNFRLIKLVAVSVSSCLGIKSAGICLYVASVPLFFCKIVLSCIFVMKLCASNNLCHVSLQGPIRYT